MTDTIKQRLADAGLMVKPLVWVDMHSDGSCYTTSTSTPLKYTANIYCHGAQGWWYFEPYSSLDAAQEAAQADYEARIYAALEVME